MRAEQIDRVFDAPMTARHATWLFQNGWSTDRENEGHWLTPYEDPTDLTSARTSVGESTAFDVADAAITKKNKDDAYELSRNIILLFGGWFVLVTLVGQFS